MMTLSTNISRVGRKVSASIKDMQTDTDRARDHLKGQPNMLIIVAIVSYLPKII